LRNFQKFLGILGSFLEFSKDCRNSLGFFVIFRNLRNTLGDLELKFMFSEYLGVFRNF
jgi:hypothetical protein